MTTKDKNYTYYNSIREDIIELLPSKFETVLDIGCGNGLTGEKLKKMGARQVVGIEITESAALCAETKIDQVITGNIETLDLPFNEEYFDVILLADVLEHLAYPEQVLKKIRPFLKKDGHILTCIPNVKYYTVVNSLIEGN